MIRGFSAAVVVFLAVEGGLAIFAADRPEPNPYVLLLTCLVAAVFSEDVWEWAHKNLRDQLGGKTSERNPKSWTRIGQYLWKPSSRRLAQKADPNLLRPNLEVLGAVAWRARRRKSSSRVWGIYAKGRICVRR